MEHTFYTGSAKISPTALLWIPITLAISLTLGLLYAVIVFYNPLIYLSALLFGGFCIVLGVAANYTISLSKCRNKWIALLLGLTLGFGALYISHVYLISNLSSFPIMQLLGAPAEVWYMAQMIAEQGYYSISDASVSGGFLWAIWGIEALGLVLVPVFLSWSETSNRVFCETCNQWADEHKNVAQFVYDDEESLKNKFLAQDLSFFDESKLIDHNTKTFYSIDEELCEKCNDLYALSLRRNTITMSDGKPSVSTDTIFEDLLVSKNTHELLGKIDECREQESRAEFNEVLKSSMALMVLADGKVEDDELDSMLQVYSNFSEDKLTQADMRAVVDEMQNRGVSIADFCSEQANKFSVEGKSLLIRAALAIASADGAMSDEEKEGIFAMANGLGLTQAEFDAIIGE